MAVVQLHPEADPNNCLTGIGARLPALNHEIDRMESVMTGQQEIGHEYFH
jgi:hypothetical protein